MLLNGYIVFFMVTLRGAAAADTACSPPPREPEIEVQGSWDEESYRSGTVATFTCRPGYSSLGVIKKACLDGHWKPVSSGKCIYVGTCDRPPRYVDMEPQGVWDEESYPADKVATFSCRPGYTQHGVIEKSCIDGEWKPVSNGRCQLKSCGPPGDIESGSFELVAGDDYVFGAVVRYTCNKGYKMMTDDNTRQCRTNGWTDNLPKCQVYHIAGDGCGPIPREEELEVQGKWEDESYPIGTLVTFTCRPSYIQQGAIKKICAGDQWVTLLTGKCIRAGASCSAPPTIAHGDFLGSNQPHYRSGFQMEYKCPEYYTLQGNRIVKCEDGEWDEPPVCLEPCTAREKELKENNIVFKWKNADKLYSKHDEIMEFICVAGYEIAERSLLRVKCNMGEIPYPKCNKIGSCLLSEETMKNQNIYINRSSAIQDGEKVTFECNKGMIPEKTLEGTCKMRVLNYPRCITANKCKLAPDVPNGRVKADHLKQDGYDSGSSVEFECDEHHSISGPINVKCENGQWSDLPQCLTIPCPPPPNIANGRPVPNLKTGYESGDKVQYMCNPGYNLKKRISEAECEQTRWKSIPVCRIVGAGPLCLKPPAIIHGDFLGPNQQNYSSGSDLEYKCPEYYTLLGHRIVTCEDGVWDEPPVCLVPCIAKEIDRSKNNIVLKWKDADKYIRHDERTEFVCAEGYEIADSSLLTVKCNKGVIPYPKCNKIGKCYLSDRPAQIICPLNFLGVMKQIRQTRAYSLV
uniref:Sushi domain-containing protein n=1 Tax=Leptobrachium leishanense TaxID=445787 RepID=A0A8C5R9E2_9ANUR